MRRKSAFLASVLFLLYGSGHAADLESLTRGLAALDPDKRNEALTEGAKKEREVVWYANWEMDYLKSLQQAFEKKYPYIRLSIFRAGGGRILDKLTVEYGAKKHLFDVVLDGSTKVLYYSENGITGAYQSPEVKYLPKGFYGEGGRWTSIAHSPMGIAYNTSLVAPESIPKDWPDLLQASWQGKMAMDTNPDETVLGLIKTWGDEKTTKYLRALAGQKLQFRRGYTLLSQLLAAGEFPVVVQAFAYRIAEMRAKGAPVNVSFPAPTVVTLSPLQVAKDPPHPHAAILLIDYLLSEEAQKTIALLGRLPSRKGVSSPHAEVRKLLAKLSDDRTAALDPEVVGKRVNDAYQIIKEILLTERKS